MKGHPCVLSPSQVRQARRWKAERVAQCEIALRLGCAESVVSRAVRGVGNYGLIAPLSTAGASLHVPPVAGGASGGGEEM